jgi:transposase
MSDGPGEPVSNKARRRWSRAVKARIVAESREPDAMVDTVAARHGINPSLLSTWRRQFAAAVEQAGSAAGFVPVHVVRPAPVTVEPGLCSGSARALESGCMKIALPDGTHLYIEPTAPLSLLCGVLGVLRG